MEPEVKDPESHLDTLSGSDCSQELYISEPGAESYCDDTPSPSDGDYPTDPRPDPEFPECRRSRDWESPSDRESLPALSGSQEDDAPRSETHGVHLGGPRGSGADSPQINTSESPPSSRSADLEPPRTGQVPRSASPSSSSSSFGQGDTTSAPTLTPARPLRGVGRQGPGIGAGSRWDGEVESSGEGGCSEAPPAPGSSGIPGVGAEQAAKWDSEFDRDLRRPDRHRGRHARLSFVESQAEKQVKENKSKCKRIALLLTNAPNPQNKGALLFNRRRQRVKKFTLVSYGTGDNESEDGNRREEETDEEEERPVGFNLRTGRDSELEWEYSVDPEEQEFNLNWRNPEEDMQQLPETKGKGIMMFAQRRQRMDAIALEHEELRRKGLPVEGIAKAEYTEVQDRPVYEMDEIFAQSTQEHAHKTYMDESVMQDLQYQDVQQMNQQFNGPKPLVPNRTAKPFLGFQNRTPVSFSPTGNVTPPVTKTQELIFKVPVPIINTPQVWSPTSDIIASRDERISVPAIKTGILPESKRRGANKQTSKPNASSNPYLENKGDRRSYIEPEEDFFSLGAEACNFMQPRTAKLKNPPPVAPKPTMNPSSLPWLRKSPLVEPFQSSSSSPVGLNSQQYLHPSQQMANTWTPVQTQAPVQPANYARAPVHTSPQPQLQSSMNSWSAQPPRSPVSMQALSPASAPPHPPPASSNKSPNPSDSVASCPPQGSSYASKALPTSPRPQASDSGISLATESPPIITRGAELFAKRQSRMQKFVVDAETVQANKIKPASSTNSLPNSWRYSPNVRAPPPLSYNPLLSPFYPPAAAKQPPSTSPTIKPKTKQKPKKAPKKHLNALDVMKHQPYQLDPSLFKYDANPDAKPLSPKPSATHTPTDTPAHTPTPKHRPISSSAHARDLVDQRKPIAPTKYPAKHPSTGQHARSPKPLAVHKQLDEKPAATSAASRTIHMPVPSVKPSISPRPPSINESLAPFSPASLIARGARQMAPRPNFTAKKSGCFAVAKPQQWKPVILQL